MRLNTTLFVTAAAALLLFTVATIGQAASEEGLTLAESIRIAHEQHPTMAQAAASLEAARSEVKSARSNFLPVGSFSGYYTRLDHDRFQEMKMDFGAGEETVRVPSMQKYQYSLGVQVTQPLFVGGSVYYNHELSRGNFEVAQQDLNATSQDVAISVAEAYYAILQIEKLLDVARKTEEAMAAHRKTASDFYSAGVVAKVDLLQAEVRLAEAQQDVIKAENSLDTAKSAFNNALGREISTPVRLSGAHLVLPGDMTLDGCMAQALHNRPELAAIRKAVEVSQSSEKLARSSFFPQVSAVYDHTYAKKSLSWDTDESWSVSLVAAWDFWEWGKQKYDLDAAKAQTNAATQQARYLEEAVLLEVKQSYLSVEQAKKLISVTERAIEQAEENVRMSKERYAQNIVTITEVLDAEVLLAHARLNYYYALYGYDLSVAHLLRAIGQKIEDEAPGGEASEERALLTDAEESERTKPVIDN